MECQQCQSRSSACVRVYIYITTMLSYYNTLRNKYIVDGYDEAYEYIQELESKQALPEVLSTNFYCYIIIQAEFKAELILDILRDCLDQAECVGGLRALTLYHTASVHFKKGDYAQCAALCQQILREFIGVYYSIDLRLEKTAEQKQLGNQLQEILYYVFLMLAYISRKDGNHKEATSFMEAGRRMLKDRKDVFSLTTKSTEATGLESPGSSNMSTPEARVKKLHSQNQSAHGTGRKFMEQNLPSTTC